MGTFSVELGWGEGEGVLVATSCNRVPYDGNRVDAERGGNKRGFELGRNGGRRSRKECKLEQIGRFALGTV